ncbi:hypothetical protein C7Y66_10975 [Chroococcidiopsis sp. CCALA 051]|uniref:hypothetical protein n=1 Tax=Chroococcidiopsis sp. CCALA 051 TaxID=869949 RepID=UPI000D0D4C21|nr:hypothetical protein [Chroococcidiopsis sp. CCALA 051]MBE9018889.1 hypothetical protein [Chroococcidiopsidales cyanobacterium LEGE 13417]PSM49136.1 hypothetical protein C7Y66_10975 [Chroococcidiopsis sp. CCALA 051]
MSEFITTDAQKAIARNMGKFSKDMLSARAMSNSFYWFMPNMPDIFLGAAVYTHKELRATVDENRTVIEVSLSSPVSQTLPSIQRLRYVVLRCINCICFVKWLCESKSAGSV